MPTAQQTNSEASPQAGPEPIAWLRSVEPYKGGDAKLPGFAHPIKLASNENPLGASPAASRAYAEAAARLSLYPDPAARALRQAIANQFGLDPDRIMCGAGSDEIFQLLARAYLAPGDEIVESQYAFAIYKIVARQAGGVARAAPERDFTADVDAMLALVGPRTKLVFLANPNNPTGTYLPASEVRRLHAGLPPHVLLVLDAAYAEFVRESDYASGLELAAQQPNVLMTRTFSKIHGLAAARVGWAYGPASVIESLNRVRGPFNVAAAAQAAAAAAIADTDFVALSQAHNEAERARVAGALTGMGFVLTPSVCNFVLIHFPETPGRTAADADAHLRARGIIPRAMASYGLPNALRVSIGGTAENDAALAAFAEFAG